MAGEGASLQASLWQDGHAYCVLDERQVGLLVSGAYKQATLDLRQRRDLHDMQSGSNDCRAYMGANSACGSPADDMCSSVGPPFRLGNGLLTPRDD